MLRDPFTIDHGGLPALKAGQEAIASAALRRKPQLPLAVPADEAEAIKLARGVVDHYEALPRHRRNVHREREALALVDFCIRNRVPLRGLAFQAVAHALGESHRVMRRTRASQAARTDARWWARGPRLSAKTLAKIVGVSESMIEEWRGTRGYQSRLRRALAIYRARFRPSVLPSRRLRASPPSDHELDAVSLIPLRTRVYSGLHGSVTERRAARSALADVLWRESMGGSPPKPETYSLLAAFHVS